MVIDGQTTDRRRVFVNSIALTLFSPRRLDALQALRGVPLSERSLLCPRFPDWPSRVGREASKVCPLLHLWKPHVHGFLQHDKGTGRSFEVNARARPLRLHGRLRDVHDSNALLHLHLRWNIRVLHCAFVLRSAAAGLALVPRYFPSGRIGGHGDGRFGPEESTGANY